MTSGESQSIDWLECCRTFVCQFPSVVSCLNASFLFQDDDGDLGECDEDEDDTDNDDEDKTDDLNDNHDDEDDDGNDAYSGIAITEF